MMSWCYGFMGMMSSSRDTGRETAGEPSSIRADMETYIHNLLTLGEDVFVSWASDHLQVPDMMRDARPW
jgi:hypothetical protein